MALLFHEKLFRFFFFNFKDWNKLLNIEEYFSGSKKYDFYDRGLCARGRLEAKAKHWEQYEDGRRKNQHKRRSLSSNEKSNRNKASMKWNNFLTPGINSWANSYVRTCLSLASPEKAEKGK